MRADKKKTKKKNMPVKESSAFISLFQAHIHHQQPCGSLSMQLSHYIQ